MKLSLRTKPVPILVVAPMLLLLVAIGVIWAVDYRQRVSEHGEMYRSESIQVGRSLSLAVERSVSSLNDLLFLGEIATLLEAKEAPEKWGDVTSEAGFLTGVSAARLPACANTFERRQSPVIVVTLGVPPSMPR